MNRDGRGIIGARDLNDEEIEMINDIRTLEGCWNALIDRLRATIGLDQRNVNIAATMGEDAFARAVRAVEQPERLTVPTEAVMRLEEV